MNGPDISILQHHVMDTAAAVITVCENYQIPYYLIEGSLLGAVRHQGMIPWDDDIDLGVPRSHYPALLELLKRELPKRFRVVTYRDRMAHLRYFTQVENTNLGVVETGHIIPLKRFAWIDIFPLDGMPSSLLLQQLRKLKILALRMLIQISQLEEMLDVKKKNRPRWERWVIAFFLNMRIGRGMDTKRLMERLDRCLEKIPSDTAEFWINSMTAYKRKAVMPREWYGSGKKLSFGPYLWNCPERPDEILRYVYGDYMTLPPPEERGTHNLRLL